MALGAWFTDIIGLHAVFGAFIMGAAMPRGVVAATSIGRIQPLTVALLLPLFFTYSGLNTQIGLLNSRASSGSMCGAVLVAAVLGKGVACWLAARATGICAIREALGIGTLMNARGLMELIIINIGLQRGIISAGAFRRARDHGRGHHAHGVADLRPARGRGSPRPSPNPKTTTPQT